MAGADYRRCDQCDSKVFYDANLNYECGNGFDGKPIPPDQIAKLCGVEQNWGSKLDWLGDWAVLCRDCAKTHKTVIVPINPE